MMIGSNIRYYRRLKQLTQNELAEAADLSSSYIAKVEAGTRKPGRDRRYGFTVKKSVTRLWGCIVKDQSMKKCL